MQRWVYPTVFKKCFEEHQTTHLTNKPAEKDEIATSILLLQILLFFQKVS